MGTHAPGHGADSAAVHHGQDVEDALSPRRVLSSDTAYEGRIWDVRSDAFELSEGSGVLHRDYIEHPGAVAILPMDDDGRILMLRQYRHPVGMDLWEIPAGLLDVDGESNLDAAARELAEEADLRASEWDVLVDFFTSPGSSSEAIRIFLARGLHEIPHSDRHERTAEEAEIQFAWVDLDHAVRAVLAGRLHNPSAVVAILAADAARRTGFGSLRPCGTPWPAHPAQR
ncbi:NUDIX hydrolase [Sinomonas cyclohexanicum]|uniref:NUDIX hydrolase n=1 Tax=Sinomonas cyclohexanicum TaxID=322009 RepID=A0ABM7PUM8_SINCY|nr:NUDIX hydrolase [Corynebacterium cyclohexanicum]BCT75849.1 NUDIX hydrolase [Corynebacterium cyclohexanicum]